MRGEESIRAKSSSETDRLDVVEESVSMSSDDKVEVGGVGMRMVVPALNGRLVEGGAAIIWFKSAEVGKDGGGRVL
jgi:hypothetical protein